MQERLGRGGQEQGVLEDVLFKGCYQTWKRSFLAFDEIGLGVASSSKQTMVNRLVDGDSPCFIARAWTVPDVR